MLRVALTVLVSVLLLASCGPLHETPPEEVATPDELQARAGYPGKVPNNWFYRQRLTAESRIPVSARSTALAEARQIGRLADSPGSWQNVGPLNVGGRVTALAVDPNDPLRIWVGTAAGGVFLTADEGASFLPVFDDQVALSIGSLVAHPTDSDTVYVGTGEDNGGGFSYDGEGVFKTTDGGTTWTSMGLAEVRRIGKMAVDPGDGERLFVAAGGDWFNQDAHRGIYRTTDGGQSWQQVLFVAEDAGGIDVVIDPSDPDRIYASIWQRFSFGTSWYIGGTDSGIWRSLDGGDTWVKLTNGLPTIAGRIGLAVAPSQSNVIYASVIGLDGSLDGIYQSVDGGDTWAVRGTPSFSSYSYYFSQIRVDPANFKTIYGLDVQLWRSLDAGQSFGIQALAVHVDWHELILEPGGRWLAGTDGGFYVSPDSGSTWSHAENLPITQFYDLAIDAQNPDKRFAGAQDNGTVMTADAGLDNWVNVLGGDGLQCEVDYLDPNLVYASAQYGNIFRSVDGGFSYSSATAGISGSFNWNAPVTLDPQVPTTLYTGTQEVYRSTDAAVSWGAISPVLTNPGSAGVAGTDADPHLHDGAREEHGAAHLQNLINNTITVVRVSAADTDVIWAGTDDGNVWVTDDGGQGWTQVNPSGQAYWVTDIAPDPFVPQRAYLAVTGYREGDTMPYVRVTEDLGQSWTDVGGNLPQVPVSSLLADTAWLGRVYAGTDLGVYVSDVGGNVWSAMRGGMPYVVVMDLVRHEATDTLFAGTHARSVFSFDLLQLGDADGDADGADNNIDCALDDPGAFAAPGEVGAVEVGRGVAGEALLAWGSLAASAGSATRYDLAQGSIADLQVSGVAGSAALSCDVSGVSYVDATALAPGEGRYYLVRGANVCGKGGWGADAEGLPRALSVCP